MILNNIPFYILGGLILILIAVPLSIQLYLIKKKKKSKALQILRIISMKRFTLTAADEILAEIQRCDLLSEIREVTIDCIEGRNDSNEPIWLVRALSNKEVCILDRFLLMNKEQAVRTALSYRRDINNVIISANTMLEARKFKSPKPLDLDQEELLFNLKK